MLHCLSGAPSEIRGFFAAFRTAALGSSEKPDAGLLPAP